MICLQWKSSFVLVYNYISLSNICVSLCSATVCCSDCTGELPRTTPGIDKFSCAGYQKHTALLPLGSRNNSKLPGKMMPALKRGKWRKPFLWCTPGRDRALPCPRLSPAHPKHSHHQPNPQIQPRASAQLSEQPSPVSQWSPSSTDWLKYFNTLRKCEVNLHLITLLHLLLLFYMCEILFRTQ